MYYLSAENLKNSLFAMQVVFEGVIGSNFRGDVAIDDVSFSTGACGSPGMISCYHDDFGSNLFFTFYDNTFVKKYIVIESMQI